MRSFPILPLFRIHWPRCRYLRASPPWSSVSPTVLIDLGFKSGRQWLSALGRPIALAAKRAAAPVPHTLGRSHGREIWASQIQPVPPTGVAFCCSSGNHHLLSSPIGNRPYQPSKSRRDRRQRACREWAANVACSLYNRCSCSAGHRARPRHGGPLRNQRAFETPEKLLHRRAWRFGGKIVVPNKLRMLC